MQGLVLALCLLGRAAALHTDAFESQEWRVDAQSLELDTQVKFVVALELHDKDAMHELLMRVSDPAHASYGSYWSAQQLSARFGPAPEEREAVLSFFRSIPGAQVPDFQGDMFEVTAPVRSVNAALQTELAWVGHRRGLTQKRAVRAVASLTLPPHLHPLVSFLSLNAPVNHVLPRAAKALDMRAREEAGVETVGSGEKGGLKARNSRDTRAVMDSQSGVGVEGGQTDALFYFQPYCGTTLNEESPPCASASAADTPTFHFDVYKHANDRANPYLLSPEPLHYAVTPAQTYCYNKFTTSTCSGADGSNCTCIAKLTDLPQYTQLRANLTAGYAGQTSLTANQSLGTSRYFALTDVATAQFLSTLYSIPRGLAAKHGSNQSVAEFYGEFYSNSDLAAFLTLSGLPNASIPVDNVFGDLVNDQSSPGGEAQLDVEYMMALAPQADTYFYSFSDLNPYDPVNEGFLTYLTFVGNQQSPPLVHSLSYGDQESNVFNATNEGSIAYGNRCDLEFLKMGLRGLTVVFSSGDDGIGGNLIRDDPVLACERALPSWPAASPYVTAIGGTQMTNQYSPLCQSIYALSSPAPLAQQLNVQCSGTAETVCSSTFGGIITSGGGFSNVSPRTLAPWQETAVATYLSSYPASYPPLSYFNSTGRAYPDVSTYASNYFVYLDGRITRESGTSASAPVFGAMVTLWNDMRLAYNQPPMGFIAPFLYAAAASTPEAFNDITTGDNACGVGYSLDTVNCCEYSFAAGRCRCRTTQNTSFSSFHHVFLSPLVPNLVFSLS